MMSTTSLRRMMQSTSILMLLYVISAITQSSWAFMSPAVGGRRSIMNTRAPSTRSSSSSKGIMRMQGAQLGDVVSLHLAISTIGNGGSTGVMQSTFDQGDVRFQLGAGGYMQAVHDGLIGMKEGEKKEIDLAADQAFGPYYQELVADIPIQNGPPGLKLWDKVKLSNGLNAFITNVDDETDIFRIDANNPNAGKALKIALDLKVIEPIENFERAQVAAGCFWGLELAYQRQPGVVATAVGYTQGQKEMPTYSEVCSGSTGHAEAVEVVYDSKVVSYKDLLAVFWARHDPTQLNRQGNDVGTQYRSGIYTTTPEQQSIAEASKAILDDQKIYHAPIVTEILPAVQFWRAEPYHQQYLERGGQIAKKQAAETIRCYG